MATVPEAWRQAGGEERVIELGVVRVRAAAAEMVMAMAMVMARVRVVQVATRRRGVGSFAPVATRVRPRLRVETVTSRREMVTKVAAHLRLRCVQEAGTSPLQQGAAFCPLEHVRDCPW